MIKTISSICLLFTLILSKPGYAGEPEGSGDEADKRPIMYYQISPKLLTFYQSSGRKMGYIVVQIQLKVRGQDNYDLVESNLPLLQDALIDFFNRQDKATIQDLSQRETLRTQATEKAQTIMKEETGIDVIEDLLFTEYVYQ